MSATHFRCTAHTVPCQHIRHYARGTSRSQEDELHLAVKQYTPLYDVHGTQPQAGDVTILACHASAFPKELYEPLWDQLFLYTKRKGELKIRNIWIADVANQGASGVLNEHALGSEPSYSDHARDLLLLVNHFRKEMPRPIVGLGHSMGGCVLLNLATLHPRLLTTIIAIEPIVNRTAKEMNFRGLYPITFRRDKWQTRERAVTALRKSPMYKSWHPDVLDLYVKYGLREGPTALYPSATNFTTLTTTRHQEAYSFARAAYPSPGQPLSTFQPTHADYPDLGVLDDSRHAANAFYNPAATQTYMQLPFVRPSCFFIYGANTHMASSKLQGRKDKLLTTGTGVGGSGGHAAGMVQEHVMKGGSHFVPFEQPMELGDIVGAWLHQVSSRWRVEEDAEIAAVNKTPMEARSRVTTEWEWWLHNLFEPRIRPSGNTAAQPKL